MPKPSPVAKKRATQDETHKVRKKVCPTKCRADLNRDESHIGQIARCTGTTNLFRSLDEITVLVEFEECLVRQTQSITVRGRLIKHDLRTRVLRSHIAAQTRLNGGSRNGSVLHDYLGAIAAATLERHLVTAVEVNGILVPRCLAVHLHRFHFLSREVLLDELLRCSRQLVEIDTLRGGTYGNCGCRTNEKRIKIFS